MTNFESLKPKLCAECHSTNIIPIVEGHPAGVLLSLFFQQKISLCGSFAIVTGSSIWACADCGEGIIDEHYCFDDKNPALIQCYKRTVEDALTNYEPIDDIELRKLKGSSFLRAFARDIFKNHDCFTLRKFEGGYHVCYQIEDRFEVEESSLFTVDRFNQMIEFIGNNNPVEFTVRVNKQPIKVLAEKLPTTPVCIKVSKVR